MVMKRRVKGEKKIKKNINMIERKKGEGRKGDIWKGNNEREI